MSLERQQIENRFTDDHSLQESVENLDQKTPEQIRETLDDALHKIGPVMQAAREALVAWIKNGQVDDHISLLVGCGLRTAENEAQDRVVSLVEKGEFDSEIVKNPSESSVPGANMFKGPQNVFRSRLAYLISQGRCDDMIGELKNDIYRSISQAAKDREIKLKYSK